MRGFDAGRPPAATSLLQFLTYGSLYPSTVPLLTGVRGRSPRRAKLVDSKFQNTYLSVQSFGRDGGTTPQTNTQTNTKTENHVFGHHLTQNG